MALPASSKVLAHSTQRGVTGILIMPGGRVVTACADGLVRIFSQGSLNCLNILRGHSGPISALAHLGGELFVSGGANLDCYLCLWRADTGERLYRRRLDSWPQSVVGEMWAIARIDDANFAVAVEVGFDI